VVAGGGGLDAVALGCFLSRLGEPIGAAAVGAGDVDDAELIEQIAVLEWVKRGCAARQARLTVTFDSSQRARQRALGVRAAKVGRGVGEQVGLARRESPSRGARHLREAKALVLQMPHTLAALAAGQVSEWAASVAVQETSCLSIRTGVGWMPSWRTGCPSCPRPRCGARRGRRRAGWTRRRR
jgi:hypothetical protein